MPTPPPPRNWCTARDEELITSSDGEPAVELKKDLEKIRRKELKVAETKRYKEKWRLEKEQVSDTFI